MANTPVAITGAVTIVGYSVTLPFVTTDSYTFSFPYLSQDDFEIEVKSETILDAADYTFTSDYLIQLTTTGVNKLNALYGTLTDVPVTIRRRTQVTTRLVDYQDGATLTEADLDLQANQLFYLVQEVYDNSELGNINFNPVDGAIDIGGAELADVGAPTGETSAATLGTVLDNSVTPEYTTAENYRQYRMVFESGNLYRANVAVTSAPAIIDLGDWDLVLSAAQVAAIGTNTTAIGTNTTDIGTNTTDIGTNATDIGTNATNLTDHEAENETAHTERDTKANLDTWALTATNGAMAYATDEKLPYIVKDTLLEAVGAGGGGGSLEIYHQETFEDTVAADFVTGNNAAPVAAGTGTLDGTLSDDTTTPLSALSSLKYVMGATSTNDFFLSPAITVDELQTDKDSGIKKYYDYNGADGDIKVIVLDQADNILTSTLDLLDGTSANKRFEVGFFIGPSVTSIRYGVQVVTGNSGKILRMDNVEFSTNPFVYKNLVEMTDWESFTPTYSAGFGTVTSNVAKYRRVGDTLEIEATFTSGTVAASAGTMTLPTGLSIDADKLSLASTTGNAGVDIGKYLSDQTSPNVNGSLLAFTSTSTSLVYFGQIFNLSVNHSIASTSVSTQVMASSDPMTLSIRVPIEGWSASSEHVVTPAKSNMTDWTAYTPTTQGFGTITSPSFIYKQVGDTYLIQGSFTTGTVSGSEAQISLPNGYSVKSGYSQKSSGIWFRGASTTEHGGGVISTSGDTYINFSTASTFSGTSSNATSVANGNQTAGSSQGFHFSATIPIEELSSDATFLAAIPVQKVAIVSQKETSGTAGGSSTANTVQTRTLNTVEGDAEIVSLSSNIFTLQAGKYLIEASAPSYENSRHQAFLHDGSSYVADGSSEYAPSAGQTRSVIDYHVTLTTSKSYTLRHWTQATKASTGLGFAADNHASNPQSQEVYGIVKITKLR